MIELTTATPQSAGRPTSRVRSVRSEGTVMLLHEALARSRMREAEQAAREHALVRALTMGRRWRLLARYAERRAVAADESVPVLPPHALRRA